MNPADANASPARQTPDQILRRVDWQINRRLDGILHGDYRSLFYGAGLDFADLREYQVEDDIRNIDWNVTARMNAPYVRQYIETREIAAWFLMDYSPSMAFGRYGREKDHILTDFVATMANVLMRNGNRVGAIFYNRGIELTMPPRGGRNQVLSLINEMLTRQSTSAGSMTDLTPLLEYSYNTIRKRSLIFLISDFICAPGWEKAVGLLNRRHEVLPVRLWDPQEVELPDVGVILVEDSETGEQIAVDTRDRKLRRRFHEASLRREAELSQTFKRANMIPLSLSTEEDMIEAIVRFALRRKRIIQLKR